MIIIIIIIILINVDDQRVLETGPVESAGYDSVSLLAEQVSHHPPGNEVHVYVLNFM